MGVHQLFLFYEDGVLDFTAHENDIVKHKGRQRLANPTARVSSLFVGNSAHGARQAETSLAPRNEEDAGFERLAEAEVCIEFLLQDPKVENKVRKLVPRDEGCLLY